MVKRTRKRNSSRRRNSTRKYSRRRNSARKYSRKRNNYRNNTRRRNTRRRNTRRRNIRRTRRRNTRRTKKRMMGGGFDRYSNEYKKLYNKPEWVNTSHRLYQGGNPFCLICDRDFSRLSLWKHHCRRCGMSVCGDCSQEATAGKLDKWLEDNKPHILRNETNTETKIICSLCAEGGPLSLTDESDHAATGIKPYEVATATLINMGYPKALVDEQIEKGVGYGGSTAEEKVTNFVKWFTKERIYPTGGARSEPQPQPAAAALAAPAAQPVAVAAAPPGMVRVEEARYIGEIRCSDNEMIFREYNAGGSGDCLFLSIDYALNGSVNKDRARELRRNMVQWINTEGRQRIIGQTVKPVFNVGERITVYLDGFWFDDALITDYDRSNGTLKYSALDTTGEVNLNDTDIGYKIREMVGNTPWIEIVRLEGVHKNTWDVFMDSQSMGVIAGTHIPLRTEEQQNAILDKYCEEMYKDETSPEGSLEFYALAFTLAKKLGREIKINSYKVVKDSNPRTCEISRISDQSVSYGWRKGDLEIHVLNINQGHFRPLIPAQVELQPPAAAALTAPAAPPPQPLPDPPPQPLPDPPPLPNSLTLKYYKQKVQYEFNTKTHRYSINKNDTVEHLKELISQDLNTPVSNLNLLLNGTLLKDSQIVSKVIPSGKSILLRFSGVKTQPQAVAAAAPAPAPAASASAASAAAAQLGPVADAEQPEGPRGLAELESTVDFSMPPAGSTDPLIYDPNEGTARAEYPEFFAKGGRVIEAPDQETVKEWVSDPSKPKPWSVGIQPTDFLIPVCHQGMNRSQVMRLVLTGVEQKLRDPEHKGQSVDTEWVSRAHGAVTGCDAHSAYKRDTLNEDNFFNYMFDVGEIFEDSYDPEKDEDPQSGPLQRGFAKLFRVRKNPRVGEEMARGRKLNPTSEYVSPDEWLEIGADREYTHDWFNTFMFAPMEHIRESAQAGALAPYTPLYDQNTLPPLTATRRIFFAFARAVPNLIERLLEVEHGALNTVIVSMQYDDSMNHELRYCAGKTKKEIQAKMIEIHKNAYEMYAKLVHADPSPEKVYQPAVAGKKYIMFYHSDGRPYYADISNNNQTSGEFPYKNQKIQLTNMGFDEKSVEESLIKADGNVQVATDILFR